MKYQPDYEDVSTLIDKINELEKQVSDLSHECETLKTEQAMFSSFMETVPDNVYFKDLSSNFVKISQNMAEWFGKKNISEVIGKSDFDLFAKDHASAAHRDEKNIIESGISLENIEEKETWNDGRTTWVTTSKAPLKDSSGNIIGTFGISRDITDKKSVDFKLLRKHVELVNEKNLLRIIIDLIPFPLYIKDTDHKYIIANTARAEDLKQDHSYDLIDKHDSEFLPPSIVQVYEEMEEHVLKSNTPLIDRELVENSGEAVYFTSIFPIKNRHMQGTVTIIRDRLSYYDYNPEKCKAH